MQKGVMKAVQLVSTCPLVPHWPVTGEIELVQSLQVAEASVIRNTMADATGMTLAPAPRLLHFAKRQDVVAWLPEALT